MGDPRFGGRSHGAAGAPLTQVAMRPTDGPADDTEHSRALDGSRSWPSRHGMAPRGTSRCSPVPPDLRRSREFWPASASALARRWRCARPRLGKSCVATRRRGDLAPAARSGGRDDQGSQQPQSLPIRVWVLRVLWVARIGRRLRDSLRPILADRLWKVIGRCRPTSRSPTRRSALGFLKAVKARVRPRMLRDWPL